MSVRSATSTSGSTPAPGWRSCSTTTSTRRFDGNLASTDPLKFVDLKPYSSRLKQAQNDTGLKDAIINAQGKLKGRPVIVSAMEYAFIGGSMGAVVGEAITRAIERAAETRTPLIIVSASGGARMMEGVISLMQLAKISAALARLDKAKVPYISLLDRSHDRRRDGIVCHAGRFEYRGTGRPDWIRRAARDRADHPAEAAARLPAQRISAEHGMLDAVVPRKQLKPYIARALEFMAA